VGGIEDHQPTGLLAQLRPDAQVIVVDYVY
jgi:hypothetical protein